MKAEDNVSISLSILCCMMIISFSFIAETICVAQTADSSIAVRIVTDEADAVLAILAKDKSKHTITEKEWQTLFSSEGFVRLKKREASLQRTFTDDEFRTFVLSDTLAGQF